MAPPTFTGALMPKKKSELQEISVALRISDQGTKDDLFNRIKRHLDLNPDLEEDPSFAGLFTNRRRRSAQPQPIPLPVPRSFHTETGRPNSRGRRVTTLEPVRESTPHKDLRDVSMLLKHPISPSDSTPNQSPGRYAIATTPSSLPPLPPSPVKSLIDHLPGPPKVEAFTTKMKENELLRDSVEMVERFRRFLSNSRNIWSLTALAEMLYILHTVIPWKTVELPLFQLKDTPVGLTFHYPPWGVFQTYAFWMVVIHWAVPTLLIPTIVGHLISFNPSTSARQLSFSEAPYPSTPFDPLTGAIMRLAAHVGYPFASFENGVKGLDVLGFRWRVLNASVGLAFAFAEAIAGTPQVFARTLATEQRTDRLLEGPSTTESVSVRRRALMPANQEDEDEVD
ncbi:hypothetical protein D9615_007756 [Tricholomella constricta]|uniref:SAP domain-containing protein n=1 Tax=Tricholomella constricta TaxID=117010 RepID=A0A8H5H363_9AGAR|nr:hypothetical protein D9615_007756 [Tricholomella constricta]